MGLFFCNAGFSNQRISSKNISRHVLCKTLATKHFLKKENALPYLSKLILPVAKATLHKRVICSAGNLVKGDNTTLHLFCALPQIWVLTPSFFA